jgi:hypothetical protein
MKTLVHTLDILGLQTFAKEANTLASHVEVCVCLCVSVSLCLCLSLSLSLSLCIQLWLLFFSPSGRVTLRRVLFFFSYPQLFCQFFFTFSPSLQDATQGHACCFEYFLFIIYLFIYLLFPLQDATQGHACCFEYSFTRIPQVSQCPQIVSTGAAAPTGPDPMPCVDRSNESEGGWEGGGCRARGGSELGQIEGEAKREREGGREGERETDRCSKAW